MTTQRHGQRTEKRVDYLAKDGEAQTASGVVMVPNTVDHHGDWERPETIEAFAAQFEAFVEADQADGGILHSVWPSDWMTLERNEVLDEAEEIGGETVPEGAWVQTWGYHDDGLWGLVEDGILGGHSIGAVNVDWNYNGESPEDVPDEVDVPDTVDVAEFYELVDGIIQEVSAVDFPAVPDAQILTASKARAATAEKRYAEHVANPDGFIEEAMERDHSEEAAQRMWDVVDRAISVEGAADPGEKSRLSRAATTILNAFAGSDDDGGSEALGGREQTAKDAPGGDTPDDDSTMSNDDEPPEWAEDLIEQTKENAERLDELQNADNDDPLEDAPEWAKAVVEQTQKNSERIEAISKQSATGSQQLGGAEKGGDDSGVDERAAFFTPESKMSDLVAQSGGEGR